MSAAPKERPVAFALVRDEDTGEMAYSVQVESSGNTADEREAARELLAWLLSLPATRVVK